MTLSAAPQDDKLFHKLEQSLKAEKSGREALMNLVAQAPFTYDREMAFLFLGFISFFVVDEEEELIITASRSLTISLSFLNTGCRCPPPTTAWSKRLYPVNP
jgi:hypothetical protein